uniref:Homeobox protein Hox-D1 n=1 Tax=Anas platyrhynchos TaxID=8839 RepID=A0A8B9SJJ4_ANAPL
GAVSPPPSPPVAAPRPAGSGRAALPRAREPAVPGTPGAGCPRRAPIGRGAGRAARSGPISGQYCPGGARGRCRSGAARAGMDLGYISIGLCRGVPVPPCPRRGPGSFPPPDIAAPPPPPACAGCAAVPCPGYERPRGAGTPGERCRDPPRPDDSGTRRPTPPEFGRPRPRPGSPTPGAAPAAPRTFEWMRVKRSPSGRSEWGGAAPPACPLRTSFSTRQLTELEKEFHFSRYLSRARRLEVARSLRLRDAQVKVWFQNRRMKQKKREREALAAPRAAPGSPP